MGWQLVSPILFFFFALCSLTRSQKDPVYVAYKCVNSDSGNYTEDGIFHSNLLSAFSNLTSLSSSRMFSNFTVGTNENATNKVYALYDCRLDLPLETCHDCVEDASRAIIDTCPYFKEAFAWYRECLLRYANRPIFATMEETPVYFACEVSIPDEGELTRIAKPILEGLIDEATSENSSSYFAVGEGTYYEHQKVYCLVQCTPDISREECKECLEHGLNHTIHDCTDDSRLDGVHHSPSCVIRYSVVRFYNVSSTLGGLPPMASPPSMLPQLKTSDDGQRFISIDYIVLFFFIIYYIYFM